MDNNKSGLMKLDPMTPEAVKVKKIFWETEDVFTIELVYDSDEKREFRFKPGQFNMLYAFGVGESAISISSDSSKKNSLLHTIHKVGYVTNVLSKLKKGDIIGLRGPFGSSWPLEEAKGKDVCIIVGGIGLAPLRPSIYHILKHRKQYGKFVLLYGARTPRDILYPVELESWRKKYDIQIEVTVDRADSTWRGHVGVVTTLLNYVDLNPEKTMAMVCGPEIMMKYAVDELVKNGIAEKEIYVSLERNMKCALGFCGHCQYGPSFVCKDGPVFSFSNVTDIFEIKEL
ncbi:MAG TPA: FAD/NAD(P)-binding protein [Ignavibacteria bacterium]|nr:FAD/NAD(P)-binding protein [Ignavibacteria bacterium]